MGGGGGGWWMGTCLNVPKLIDFKSVILGKIERSLSLFSAKSDEELVKKLKTGKILSS